jgi:hypothetical protein
MTTVVLHKGKKFFELSSAGLRMVKKTGNIGKSEFVARGVNVCS